MHPRGATPSPPSPTLGRGRAIEAWLGLILAVSVVAPIVSPAAAQDLSQPNRQLADLESDTERLMSRRVQPHDLKSDTFVEERLTDGELYLRLEDYLRAAILFTNRTQHKRGPIYHKLASNTARLALKLHASIRLDLRQAGRIQSGKQEIGQQIQINILKNSLSPCINCAELDIMYNDGIRKTGEILDLGIQQALIEIQDQRYIYRTNVLGIGRLEAQRFLEHNANVCSQIETEIRQALLPTAYSGRTEI